MAKPRVTFVPLEDLVFDERVNRSIKQSHVDRIVRHFNEDLLGVIMVSELPSGKYLVEDGQHRATAMRTVYNGNGRVRVLVQIQSNGSPGTDQALRNAARRFVGFNTSLAVTPIDRFLKGVTAGDQRYCAINTTVESLGLRVSSYVFTEGDIRCASSLERIYDEHGEKRLREVLTLALDSWGKTGAAVNGDILLGISAFLHRYGDHVDRETLRKKLAGFPGGPSNLLGQGRGAKGIHGSTVARNVAGIVTATYNKGRRSGALPDWWSK